MGVSRRRLAGGQAALCWASRLFTQSAVFWPLEELGEWTAGLGDLGARGQEGVSGRVNDRSGGKAAGAHGDEQIPTGKARLAGGEPTPQGSACVPRGADAGEACCRTNGKPGVQCKALSG